MNIPIDEKDDDMTEQQYLEMANHLKQTYDKMEEKLLRSEIKIMDLKKELMTAYGLVRIIDNILDNLYEVPHEVVVLVECLRGNLSDSMDKNIFNVKDIEEYV
mgnify:CR=1 FL=1|tara:strand:+ start:3197 stop:3505 length:309 start_codon:yes stop_codon:yes gene_type:complete